MEQEDRCVLSCWDEHTNVLSLYQFHNSHLFEDLRRQKVFISMWCFALAYTQKKNAKCVPLGGSLQQLVTGVVSLKGQLLPYLKVLSSALRVENYSEVLTCTMVQNCPCKGTSPVTSWFTPKGAKFAQ